MRPQGTVIISQYLTPLSLGRFRAGFLAAERGKRGHSAFSPPCAVGRQVVESAQHVARAPSGAIGVVYLAGGGQTTIINIQRPIGCDYGFWQGPSSLSAPVGAYCSLATGASPWEPRTTPFLLLPFPSPVEAIEKVQSPLRGSNREWKECFLPASFPRACARG